MDDEYMKIFFKDNFPCVKYVLEIITELANLTITSLVVEDTMPNLHGHGVRLDVHARDAAGREYNIEVQRSDKGAGVKRARFNSSLLDANNLPAGEKYDSLPETYVIFITENDVLGKNLPIYHIERYIRETNDIFGDQSHIIYVNGHYCGSDPLGQLMRDFNESDPEKMSDSPLKETARQLKETPEGVSSMCKAIEQMRSESEARGREEATLDNIRAFMKATGETAEKVMSMLGIQKEQMGKYLALL